MAFEKAFINKLSESSILQKELSLYKNKLSIFRNYIPKDAQLPLIKFSTSYYDIPTLNTTIELSVSYYKYDINPDNSKHILFELVDILDNKCLCAPKKDSLRLYVSSNPIYVLGTLDEISNYATVKFIVRGAINQWRIM